MAERAFINKLKRPVLGFASFGAAVAISCSGDSDGNPKSVDSKPPTIVALETFEPTLAVDTETPTPEIMIGGLPVEAENFLDRIDNETSLGDEQVEALRERFSADWTGASSDEYLKYGAFVGLRSSLAANYKQTQDESVLGVMQGIQEYLASNAEWETFYNASLSDGAFEN